MRYKGDLALAQAHGTPATSHWLHPRWSGIKARCYNPRCPQYGDYGGRGIQMSEDWVNDFWAFADWVEENLGPCPPGYTLDRVDNDEGYVPGNLRWADRRTQRLNQRNASRDNLWGGRRPDIVRAVVPFTYDWSTYRLARYYGVSRVAITNRLRKYGWRGSSLGGLPRGGGKYGGR